jgi:hypothetical protein
MRCTPAALLFALVIATPGACGGDPPAGGGDGLAPLDSAAPVDTTTAADTGAPEVADDTAAPTPTPLAGQSFGAPQAWATPIADYLAAGEAEVKSLAFLRGIHDLASYEGQLYLGFGDANLNLGRIFPIDFRAFTDPSDATAHGELVTDEEQLDRYRRVGPDLLMAGHRGRVARQRLPPHPRGRLGQAPHGAERRPRTRRRGLSGRDLRGRLGGDAGAVGRRRHLRAPVALERHPGELGHRRAGA